MILGVALGEEPAEDDRCDRERDPDGDDCGNVGIDETLEDD
jgi:hypothetical protein